jgi:hypothetical protein
MSGETTCVKSERQSMELAVIGEKSLRALHACLVCIMLCLCVCVCVCEREIVVMDRNRNLT